ncbi:acyltransferase family protein [Neobacillus sp. LXY-4]|uniref:acyltransferase family protein n=1 Tax=Neobacillus sp. LXY-4 TaxID=3379826 RepID=UPI003EE3C1BF
MKSREAYYDNAKFILVFLMVFGHLIQSYIQENKLIFSLYSTIYLFHMPAFILISGYFAKGFHKKGYLLKIAKKLILPYLIFQGIYSFYYYFLLEKDALEFDPLIPEWSLWFLISLFFWNVMLFLFTKWQPVYSFILSITLGIIVGYIDVVNDFLSISRTIVFFPLFLLGYYFKKDNFAKLANVKIKLFSVLLFILIVLALYFLPEFNHKWLFGSKPYEAFNVTGMMGAFVRLGVYSLTLLATFSFFAFVPQKQYFFTKWGARSLYVYLLHGFFIKYFRNSKLEDLLNVDGKIVVMVAISLLIIAFLSSNVINAITQPLIELKISTLKKYTLNVYSKIRNHKLIPNDVREQGTFE